MKFLIDSGVPISADNKTQESIYKYDQEVIQNRNIAYPIHPIIAARRSTRAMTGESIDDSILNSIFEAARWAPSYYNTQVSSYKCFETQLSFFFA